MAGRGDPPPRSAAKVPDITTQAHTAQLQLMAMASRPAAGHGGPSRGSILGLGGGGKGSARGTGRQGSGRGRAQGCSAGKATGRRWAVTTLAMLPARATVSSTTTPATQANCFAHRVLQRPRLVVASTTLPATQASHFAHRVLQRPIKQKRKGPRGVMASTMP